METTFSLAMFLNSCSTALLTSDVLPHSPTCCCTVLVTSSRIAFTILRCKVTFSHPCTAWPSSSDMGSLICPMSNLSAMASRTSAKRSSTDSHTPATASKIVFSCDSWAPLLLAVVCFEAFSSVRVPRCSLLYSTSDASSPATDLRRAATTGAQRRP